MKLLQIIYTSQLLQPAPSDLQDILQVSRKHNGAAGITGMLLVADELVLQLLEGPPQAVALTFQRIRNDKRHANIVELGQSSVTKREFAEWAMGYSALHAGDVDTLRHYFATFSVPINPEDPQAHQALAREVLESFSAWTMDEA